jgi:hypothetical protein
LDTNMTESGVPSGQERRRFPRYRCQGSAEICSELGGAHQWGTFTDLSQGGCYIEMPAPLSLNQFAYLNLTVDDLSFSATGKVVVVHPMFGMGVIFTAMDPESIAILAQIMRRLSGSIPDAAQQTPVPPHAAPSGTRPMRLSPQAAVSMLSQIAKHLAQRGVLTQQDFLAILEKNRNAG